MRDDPLRDRADDQGAARVIRADSLGLLPEAPQEPFYRRALGPGTQRRGTETPRGQQALLGPVALGAQRVGLLLQEARGDELLEGEVDEALLLSLELADLTRH
ncbi:MAG: hypothetical protein M3P16_02260 [Chloroflexota bacterium]|nr:hypothetical protein [Chloroflexota bacterium]